MQEANVVPNKIIQLNKAAILTNAGRHERLTDRQEYRTGYHERNLTTTAGDDKLKVPKLKGVAFETTIIEGSQRWESLVE